MPTKTNTLRMTLRNTGLLFLEKNLKEYVGMAYIEKEIEEYVYYRERTGVDLNLPMIKNEVVRHSKVYSSLVL